MSAGAGRKRAASALAKFVTLARKEPQESAVCPHNPACNSGPNPQRIQRMNPMGQPGPEPFTRSYHETLEDLAFQPSKQTEGHP